VAKCCLLVFNENTNQIVFVQFANGLSKSIGQLSRGRYRFQTAAYNDNGASPLTFVQYFDVVCYGEVDSDRGYSSAPILPSKNARLLLLTVGGRSMVKTIFHTYVDFIGSKAILAIADGTVVSAALKIVGATSS